MLKKMETQITEISRQKTPKKQVSKPKKIFFYWAVAVLLAFFALAIFVFQHIEKDNEPQKLRLQVLKNKCYMGQKLDDAEKEELCSLLGKYENKFTSDCENINNLLFKQHFENFSHDAESCVISVNKLLTEKGFSSKVSESNNKKGVMITAFWKNKKFFEIRLMHRSSSKYERNHEYYRVLFVNASFYFDKDGQENQDPFLNHIKYNSCEDILHTLSNALNNSKIKNELQRKN